MTEMTFDQIKVLSEYEWKLFGNPEQSEGRFLVRICSNQILLLYERSFLSENIKSGDASLTTC